MSGGVFSFHDYEGQFTLEADVAIAGAGPGGAAAAARLAESGKRVVMLEAGRYYRPQDFPNTSSEALNSIYLEEGQLASSGPTFVPLAAGRGVGGSSLINSAICFRGPEVVLEAWADRLGNARYGPEAMAVKYDEVEATIGVAPVREDAAVAGVNNLKALEGIRDLGLDGGPMDRNAPGCVGCGVCQLGCPVGGKGSVDRNFLAQRALRHDTQVFADARVAEILVEGGHARGLRAVTRDPETGRRGPTITVRSERTIIAGGAIGTAKLFLLTGVAANDHVGRHLRIHPSAGSYGFFGSDIKMWRGITQGVYAYHPTDPDVVLEVFSVPTEVLFAEAARLGHAGKTFLGEIAHLAGLGALVRDDSEGTVALSDRGRALITYELEERDLAKLRRGLTLSCEVFFAAGAERVKPGAALLDFADSMAEIERGLAGVTSGNELMLYASHPQGTCRMARRPEEGVTDPRGAVFGVEGLYVADGSLFPGALGRNPQMTVMAFALHVAEQMLEDW